MRLVAVMLVACLFAGCADRSFPPDHSAEYMQGQTHASSGYYLQQMQQSSNDSRTNWQLLAIRALLQEQQQQQAQTLYQQLPADLNQSQQIEKTLLAVQMLLMQQDYSQASAQLATLDVRGMNAFQQQRYWRDHIEASQGEPSLTLLRALIALEPYLQGEDKQKNIDATWQALSHMTPEQASALVINAEEYTLRSWLDLQHSWFASRSDPALLASGIKDWQTRYPQNPATSMLPSALLQPQQASTASTPVTGMVALLLPLNGQGAVFGAAIQQGFELAKNNGTSPVMMPVAGSEQAEEIKATDDQSEAEVSAGDSLAAKDETAAVDFGTAEQTDPEVNQGEAPVISRNDLSSALPAAGHVASSPATQLTIYDTSLQPLEALLAQVQQDGASIVIGPLLKENVAALTNSSSTLNILALNQPESAGNQGNICYFALSPEDEARDAARHIWWQGQRNPLILIPRSQLGNRISLAFAREWQQLGGDTVLQQTIGSTAELKQEINHNGRISLTGSAVVTGSQNSSDAAAAQRDTDANSASATAHSAVDSVYIIASQQDLTLIRSLISMRIGSRSHVAFYASSRSAQGGAELDYRIEMEGLQFSEIPMLAGGNPVLMHQALMAVNGDYSLARLYAMGVDAWTLASHFTQLRQLAGFTVDGNTGQIVADQNCVLHRKLSWLKYHQGHIVPVE